MSPQTFNRLFYIQRFWNGRIILIGIRAYALKLDFRRSWIDKILRKNKL